MAISSCNDCKMDKKCTVVLNAEEEPKKGKNIFTLPLTCDRFLDTNKDSFRRRIWWPKEVASHLIRMRHTLPAGPDQVK